MSSLRGEPGTRWSLPGSVDALADAARQAGRPGVIWLAGLAYQIVVLGWSFGIAVALPALRESLPSMEAADWRLAVRPLPVVETLIKLVRREGLGSLVVAAPLVYVLFRLAAGLVKLSPGESWVEARGERPAPGLRRTWREGRGLALPGIGLCVLFLGMMFGVTLLFAGPARLLVSFANVDDWSLFAAIITGVLIALMLIYSFMLSILFQLALHSLVQNRRGVGSALHHAWRIAKNDPMATVRATIVDAVLYSTIAALYFALDVVLAATQVTSAALYVIFPALWGFAGCARCAFWARAYQTLGGLSTVDGTPG